METQKIINLLNDSSNEESKFATKNWYVIDSQTTKGKYKQGDVIKFKQKLLNQVFAIILMHLFYLQEILQKLLTMIPMLHLKIVHHFLHV